MIRKIVRGAARRILRSIKERPPQDRYTREYEVHCDTVVDLENVIKDKDLSRLRIYIPAERICMHGGYRYAQGWHPFIAVLEQGKSELSFFYRFFQPKDVAEMHFLSKEGQTGETLPPWSLPWLNNEITKKGEKGLSFDHGVSYYGPVSEKKLAVEYDRLHKTSESISRQGYLPNRYGDINGWFLKRDEEFLFFVRGGKHRAAVLSNLGFKFLPVVVRDVASPLISLSAFRQWPAVESQFSITLAQRIFNSYFELDGRAQHKLMVKWASQYDRPKPRES